MYLSLCCFYSEVKTQTVNVTQKNGDIYVMERQVLYDPVKKYNRILSSKLIARIPKGEKTPVPTRSKRPKGSKSEQKSKKLSALRQHVGMMDIIQHIGEESGIDDAVYASTDTGTAQKIISLARYLLATNGQTLPGIQTWQFNHPLPYRFGISEDVYHDLFVDIGLDESLQQNFFRERCSLLDKHNAIAYDSTTVSTYSVYQPEARYGFNKAKDCFKALEKYRKREAIEDLFQAEKQQADGSRARVWTPDTLRGRMFVQFVELCYFEYFAEKIRQLKKDLRTQESDETLSSEEIKLIRKLRNWIENTPLYLQLQWFDTVEEVKVSSELHNRRWNTEVTARDRLYLDNLAVDL